MLVNILSMARVKIRIKTVGGVSPVKCTVDLHNPHTKKDTIAFRLGKEILEGTFKIGFWSCRGLVYLS